MQQQFREPRIDLGSEFHSLDTMRELPAMPKQSSYSGTYGWQNSLPQISKPDYPPYWDKPPKSRDIEKMTGRACIIGMAVVTLAFGMTVLVIFAIKLVQFSMTVTLK